MGFIFNCSKCGKDEDCQCGYAETIITVHWVPIPEKSKDHWKEYKSPEDSGCYWEAIVKWDGCIHLSENVPVEENSQYLHICSIRETIERLQELEKLAIQAFGDRWPTS